MRCPKDLTFKDVQTKDLWDSKKATACAVAFLLLTLYFYSSELEELTGNFVVGILGGLLKREAKREKGTAVISTARHRCSGRDEGS